ncbi:hypothetical protein ACFT7S_01375 [Streptomyces sp. NPDC057136]|uniref:hypothetical protein n=1 Tax=Streptomyces sp. NPDC057136 TaxID=3346029 RepID=UPI00362CA622
MPRPVPGPGGLAPAFLKGGARAGEGWVFAEAYDAAGLIARAAEATSATDAERGGVAQRLFLLTYPGITRPLSFHPTHRVRIEPGIFLYRIEDGRARFLGPYTTV